MLLLIDFGLKSLLGRLLAEDILEEAREREAIRIKADISSPAADRTLRGNGLTALLLAISTSLSGCLTRTKEVFLAFIDGNMEVTGSDISGG